MIIQDIFSGPECTLQEILESRENRVKTYTSLAAEYECTNAVILCVNMPGKIKNNPASNLFFQEAKKLIRILIANPLFVEEKHEKTGPELYLGTKFDSQELKQTIVHLEKKYPWLRMVDIDVVDCKAGHISRTQIGENPRTCFVCSKNAKECSSHNQHSEEEIKTAITDCYVDLLCSNIGNLASESLLQEANCTPKPGLVDQNNCGSHKDMTLRLLTKSAITLQPFFEQMCKLGFENAPVEKLRLLGQKAEQAMFKTTDNVNTHKGAIFCLGFMAYSFGKCVIDGTNPTAENICNTIRKLTEGIEKEVPKEIRKTRGLGARGQAVEGYPIITGYALPFFIEECKNNDVNRALSLTLLLILSKNEDSNILSRSDSETLYWAQNCAENLFAKRAEASEIEKLDREFIIKNISPGGSADLLSATYFLSKIVSN